MGLFSIVHAFSERIVGTVAFDCACSIECVSNFEFLEFSIVVLNANMHDNWMTKILVSFEVSVEAVAASPNPVRAFSNSIYPMPFGVARCLYSAHLEHDRDFQIWLWHLRFLIYGARVHLFLKWIHRCGLFLVSLQRCCINFK